MSNNLIPTIVRYGSQFIEAYKRKSRASIEEQVDQGLDSNSEATAIIGAVAIKEYICWQTENIKASHTRTFKLSRWGADLAFESCYVENSTDDFFWLEVLDPEGRVLIKQYAYRNKTPINFPSNPLPAWVTIRIRAIKELSFIRFTAVPCKILETFLAEEDYQALENNN